MRKKVLVTKLFEDLKVRQRANKVDLATARRALNKTIDLQQTVYVRLDEGLTSLSGKVWGYFEFSLYACCSILSEILGQISLQSEFYSRLMIAMRFKKIFYTQILRMWLIYDSLYFCDTPLTFPMSRS